MCGIVGAIADGDAIPFLMKGLSRLEYRGYDSAGVALLSEGTIERRRAKGDLSALRELLRRNPPRGAIGIGHTRWATHGAPSEKNAHPHIVGETAIVHNGIIENGGALKNALREKGAIFTSQTDSEVIAHLFHAFLADGLAAEDAFAKTLESLEGAFAIAALTCSAPNSLFAAARRSPLVIGRGGAGVYVASDALALAAEAESLIHLEDGERARLTREGFSILNAEGRAVKRVPKKMALQSEEASKGGRRFFMEKEIYETPEAAARALAVPIGEENGFSAARMRDARQIFFLGCGSAFYAGLAASCWMEKLAGVSARAEIASEFRHRGAALSKRDLAVFVSQSGETADTLSALRHCEREGVPTLALVNVVESTMARLADWTLSIGAGPEIGVASTKTLICQMILLARLALSVAKPAEAKEAREDLSSLPRKLQEALAVSEALRAMAKDYLAPSDYVLYLGRGAGYAVALEGALKCKEIAYIPSDGAPAGEMKHGPIALIQEKTPVVVVAPYDRLFPKMLSNMEEIAARGGYLCLLTDAEGAAASKDLTRASVALPAAGEIGAPILHALAAQMLAYHCAVALKHNPDRPRNLAKSVTVE